ncbi:DUF6517 family protein [Methanohalobium sp.]|uniref:DUF6517 family protein n=1 Tax=Methanohalobium sp. TaxID=2837493 RepID=UPI0025D0EE19|nr:DUF6517 family protein [Methanohalobium sp.]
MVKSLYIYPILILTVILATSVSGCLETPEATPAEVSESALSEYGWENTGSVDYQSYEQSVADYNVSVNTAITTYKDKQLSNQMSGQIKNLQRNQNIDLETDFGTGILGSRLVTINLTLPSGVELPDTVISTIVDTQIEKLTKQANIENFDKKGSEEINISDGSTANADYYVGSIPANGFSIDVRGVIASWSTSDSTIITVGAVPEGDIELNIEGENVKLITINGEKEMEEVKALIKSIN